MDPVFFELHSDLPREGPGSKAATTDALARTGLTGPLRILDAGCGPGAASLVLLEALPGAHVLALDLHAPFLDTARARAGAAGVADRLETAVRDMGNPGVAPASLDLIWCEAAIYAVGVEPALRAWSPLLAPGGRIVFSELIWTDPEPPEPARAFWAAEYPAMTDRAGVLALISASGLRCLNDFALPEDAWAAYYAPLSERGAALAAIHGADHPVLVENRHEIAMRAAHGGCYAYQFFVVAP